jgi:apolipoprotein N-acyltransferase
MTNVLLGIVVLAVPALAFGWLVVRAPQVAGHSTKTMVATPGERALAQRRLWIALGISALSGVLIAASMPPFDVSILGWVALVPLLLAIRYVPEKPTRLLALPFGIIWSIAVHNWYPDVFGFWYPGVLGRVLGIVLMLFAGSYYAWLIAFGVRLQRKLPAPVNLLALPVLWSAIEFVKYVAPIVEDWWFVWLANSQWRFPPALQILSITGLPGLSFLLMLANVAIAALAWGAWREHKLDWSAALGLGCVAAVVAWGAMTIPAPPANTFTIAATTDLVLQDQNVQKLSRNYPQTGGVYPDTPAMSQAVFDVNAALTRQASAAKPAFVVWPENKFASADDQGLFGQVGALSQEVGAYIVANAIWLTPAGKYNAALLVGPDGREIGRRAKINLTSGEKQGGFVAGPNDFPVYETPYGKVGLAVCWDRHRLWIIRELARAGAQIVLMPVDDDFSANRWFPPFHAADGVFRAVENRVTIGLGTTNGVSLVVDPYGRITAEGHINESGVVTGQTFVTSQRSLYTMWGDWFGWLMVAGLLALAGIAALRKSNG